MRETEKVAHTGAESYWPVLLRLITQFMCHYQFLAAVIQFEIVWKLVTSRPDLLIEPLLHHKPNSANAA